MRRFLLPLLLLLTASVAVALTPAAPPVVVTTLLDTARVAVARGDWAASVRALNEAAHLARRQAPLVVSAGEVVTGAHVGVGVYDKAVGGVVGDKRLRLYVEVENLAATSLSPGRFRHELDVVGRFFVVDGGTLEPLGEKNLGRQTVDVWRPLDVHAVGLDVTLGDAPVGPYVVEVVVTDVASGRTASRRIPFVLR